MMSALSTVLLGHGALARTVVVVGAMPLGVWGAYRLVRTLTACAVAGGRGRRRVRRQPGRARRDRARRARSARLLRARAVRVPRARTRELDARTTEATGVAGRGRRWRGPRCTSVARSSACWVRSSGSVWPPAILLAVVIAVVFVVSIPLAGATARSCARPRWRCLGTVVSVLLLAAVVVVADRRRRVDVGPARRARRCRSATSLRFDVGSGPLGLVHARPPRRPRRCRSSIASGPRLVWATRAWVLTLASFALAWVPTRISATAPVPAPDGRAGAGRVGRGVRGRPRRERAARRHAPLALRVAPGVGGGRRGRARAAVARVRGRHRVGALGAPEHRLADLRLVDERRPEPGRLPRAVARRSRAAAGRRQGRSTASGSD